MTTQSPSGGKERSHWAVELVGTESDLRDWEAELGSQHDPWVEKVSQHGHDHWLLRSRDFDSTNTAAEVRERAVAMLKILNGAMKLAAGSNPVTFAGLWECMKDGTKNVRMFAEPIVIVRGVRAKGAVGSQPSGPSLPQQWSRVAQANPKAAEMLAHYGADGTWYELYKTYECACSIAGSQRRLAKRGWASRATLKKFAETANYFHRHARNLTQKPPQDPMTLAEAIGMVRAIVHALLDELASDEA